MLVFVSFSFVFRFVYLVTYLGFSSFQTDFVGKSVAEKYFSVLFTHFPSCGFLLALTAITSFEKKPMR